MSNLVKNKKNEENNKHLSEYEVRRLENLASNQKMLQALGLDKPPSFAFPVPTKSSALVKSKRKAPFKPSVIAARRSQRQCVVRKTAELDSASRRRSERVASRDRNPQVFGHIPGIEIGTTWKMRMHCSQDGVHAPTVAGISGNQQEGAYSIALSGGYEDDIDWGEAFTYTGCGGRDLKGSRANPKNLRTAKQSKDQTMEGLNLALKVSCDTGRPVRVIRGYKLNSPYAPVSGYRYDGLYRVEKCWEDRGLSGFQVVKFAFVRLPKQPPIEIRVNYDAEDEETEDEHNSVRDDDETEETDNKIKKSEKSSNINHNNLS
ncbi:12194_t:CDS:2 [Ambispora gerdemannii]|uniref:12194_t:CDS:1 n=1 Tax=Ambispora gerdemannii TaxID=144530 RepID=A0A9N9F2G4_9GLOM|nr:12194_t:CDS:2 [Ambispora gerdemannii]